MIKDADDPCTLHLSAAISTNGETSVDYRFVNEYGQPSNTYTVDVDATHVAMVDHSVAVPYIDAPDTDGDLAPTPGGDEIGGLTGAGSDLHTGTYELEILSPNPMTDAEGFEVEYCTTGDPAIEPPTGELTTRPDPTHDEPTTVILVNG